MPPTTDADLLRPLLGAAHWLLSTDPAGAADAWDGRLANLAEDGQAGRLGHLDPRAWQQAAGFDALDTALDRALPLDAVLPAGDAGGTRPLEAYVPPAWDTPPSGRSDVRGQAAACGMVDPDACHRRLADGGALRFPQAWRVLPGLRPLWQRLARACPLDVEIDVLLMPPRCALRLGAGHRPVGHGLLGVADGGADLCVLLPSGQAAPSPRLGLLPDPHRLLQAHRIDGLAPGDWAYAPDTRVQSIECVSGAMGAALVLVGLATPSWDQLAGFALSAETAQGLAGPVRADVDPPALLPSGQALQDLLDARRRQRLDRRADVRQGRLHDILQQAAITAQTPLRVRADRSVSVRSLPMHGAHMPGLLKLMGMPATDRVGYHCFGRAWVVPVGLQAWVDSVLAREDSFCPADLPRAPAGTGLGPALDLCREMLAHGLLQHEQPG